MATNNCTCDPTCPCQEPVLNFTVEEINEILAGSPINCSERYSNAPGQPALLTISEAIPLVEEKERALNKQLLFLNHDTEPEFWIFKGKTLTEWFDINSWVSLPMPKLSELTKYVFSTSIRGIEVVDEAPSAVDNVLYMQYEPLPDTAKYGFDFLIGGSPIAGVAIPVYVTLYTKLLGKSGVERVRILFQTTKAPKDGHIQMSMRDSQGVEYNFTDHGWWGPSNGFNMPMEYEATTEVSAIFTAPGIYEMTCKLIQVDSGTILAVGSEEVIVS